MLARLPADSADVVFSLAVLEHVHPDGESLFAEARVAARFVLTIEDEQHVTGRQLARDYGRAFEALGLRTVFLEPTPPALGLDPGFVPGCS